MNPFLTISLLIVDDEPEIRAGLRTIIPWEDYSIAVIGTAANGAEALDMIRFYEPDIVITDIQMPGINGLDLIQRTKQEQFDCSFVILSGYDDFQYAKAAIRYGVNDYLLKPISIQELTELVKKLCQEIETKRHYRTNQLETLHTLRSAQISLKKQNIIPQLLRGELSSGDLQTAISEYGFSIKNNSCCATLLQAFPLSHDHNSEDDMFHCLSTLRKQLESFNERYPMLVSELPSSALLLITNVPFEEEGDFSLQEFLKIQMKEINITNSFRLVAAMGSQVMNLKEIQASYQTARQVMTWHIYPELGSVIEDHVLIYPEPPTIMPSSKLLDYILKDDTLMIVREFEDYLNDLCYIPLPPPSYLYSMCNYLIIDLKSQLSRYLDGEPKSFTGNSYLTLQNLASLESIKTWMCEILCKFAEELSVKQASRTDPFIEKAIDYIQKNFLKNIRTEEVCNYLGLSKSYFSTYFKSKTNLNFRDYTLDLKISYAQEQLKTEQNTPTDISILLGYEDYRSFSRAFKTRTGMSPTDYQKQYLPGERSGP